MNRKERIELICNQMIKGTENNSLPSKNQRLFFYKKHKRVAEWLLDKIPRCSPAISAVIMKCLIKYDFNKVNIFCKTLREQCFNGINDPVYLLWVYLLKKYGKNNTNEVYQKTVYAAQAYMEDKKIERLRTIGTDIFEWNDKLEIPDQYIENYNNVHKTIGENNET